MKIRLDRAKALVDELMALGPGTHASSIAYFMFLSVIPLITLGISLVTMTGLGQREVAEFLSAVVPDAFGGFVQTLVDDAFGQSGVALSLSTLALLVTASQGVRALAAGLNAAYGVREERHGLVVVVVSAGVAVAIVCAMAATIYLVFGGVTARSLALVDPGLSPQGEATETVSLVVSTALGVIVLAACYTFLPCGSRPFVRQLPGAAAASVLCGALTVGFRVYVDHFCNFERLYGSLSTVALFMFWMFVASYIVIACAFLNRTLERRSHAMRESSESVLGDRGM